MENDIKLYFRGTSGREVFPIGITNAENDNKIIQVAQLDTETRKNSNRFRTYDPSGIGACLSTMGGGGLEPCILVKEATKKGYAEANVGDSINISHPNSKTRRGRVGKQIANTLLTGEEQAVIVQKPRGFNKGGEHEVAPTLSSNSWQENNLLKSGIRIRKLTPRECWRLQGFPDWAFDKAQEVNSNSQLYKQAGNSVTVPVIYEIARRFE